MTFLLVSNFSKLFERKDAVSKRKKRENYADTTPVEKVRYLRKRRSY